MNKIKAIVLVAVLAITSVACSEEKRNKATDAETQTARTQLSVFLEAQPVPAFKTSQLRQNLIDIETAQAETTATTSFMFLLAGVGESGPLVHWCPSIGFPIPATYQLTNPNQVVNGDNGRASVISQLEATGVYTGDTTGTYVICVDPNGKAYAFYHEGFVSTVTVPAHWDTAKGEIAIDGEPSAEFSTGG